MSSFPMLSVPASRISRLFPDRSSLEKSLTGEAGALLYLVERLPDEVYLVKGAGGAHKYVKREPTGKVSPKWRYWYKVPGQGIITHDMPVAGARYKATHDGVEGHYHVKSSNELGVHVQHTGTGVQKWLSQEEFAAEVNGQHAGAHKEAAAGKRAEILAAIKVLHEGKGGPRQIERVRRLVQAAQAQGWISPSEAQLYGQNAATAQNAAGQRVTSAAGAAGAPWGSQKAPPRPVAPPAPAPAPQAQAAQAPVPAPQAAPAAGGSRGKEGTGTGLEGRKSRLTLVGPKGLEKQDFTYRLVPAASLIPSHSPSRGFKKNPAYPKDVQERTYHANKEQQVGLQQKARNLDPDLLINTNPDAAQGPPVIMPNGVVLGGNSRAMMMEIAYGMHPEAIKAYKASLAEQAGHFGFDPSDLDKIENPVLVREVADPGNKDAQRKLVRQYNVSLTREMNPREEMVAKGRLVKPKENEETGRMEDSHTYQAMDMFGRGVDGEDIDETFNEFLESPRSERFVKALWKDGIIDDANQDRYTKMGDSNRLNEEGRTFASKILLGSVVDSTDDLEDMGSTFRDRFNANLPVIIAAGRNNKAFDLVPALKRSASLLANMRRAKLSSPTDAVSQDQLVDKEGKEIASKDGRLDSHNPVWNDPLAQAVTLAVLGGNKSGPAFREFGRIAAQPSSAGGMFDDGPSDEQRAMMAMQSAFGFGAKPFQEKKAAEEEKARAKKLRDYTEGKAKLDEEQRKRGMKVPDRAAASTGEGDTGAGSSSATAEKKPRKPRSDIGKSRGKRVVVPRTEGGSGGPGGDQGGLESTT